MGYPDIARRVAKFLGYTNVIASLTADELEDVVDAIKTGLRWFYYPDPLPGENYAYVWSFMRPTSTIVTVAADYAYDLPDNFNAIVGPGLTFAAADAGNGIVKIVGAGMLRDAQSGTNTPLNGIPRMAAIQQKTFAGTTGERFEILLFPTPDRVFTLTYQYEVNPEVISSGVPYPYGGASHAETLLQLCIAAADLHKNDKLGEHYNLGKAMLVKSVMRDRKNQPHYFGKNIDRSDPKYLQGDGRRPTAGQVTYNDTLY